MEDANSNDMDYFRNQMRMQFYTLETQTDQMQQKNLGLGFAIHLPREFEPGNVAKISQIFPSQYRPPVILTSPTENTGVAFQLLKGDVSEKPGVLSEHIRNQIQMIDSKTVFYDSGTAGKGEEIAWLEYKSFASDERVYNLLFLFQTKAGMVMGIFFCIFKDYTTWKPIVLSMLDTICVK